MKNVLATVSGGSLPNFILSNGSQMVAKEDFSKAQHRFLIDLANYVNSSLISYYDLIFLFFSPIKAFYKKAKILTSRFNCLREESAKSIKAQEMFKIRVDPYKGNNKYVHEMIECLDKKLKNDLFGAYVHGSLATNEECNYSDFDAVAIIKDDVFSTPKRLCDVALKLNKASLIMFKFDPIQHHGWFVFTETDLQNYPDYYFPSELLNYSKSLFYDKGLALNIRVQNSHKEEKLENFDNLNLSIIKTISSKKYPRNAYELKGLLSKFMLLPALYIQARDGKGIFKKFSFEEAKRDFDESDWRIMDEVSEIRKNWQIKISAIQKILLTSPNQFLRYFSKKWAPMVPDDLKKILTPSFYERIKKLALMMRKNLELEAIAHVKRSSWIQ